MRGAIHLGVNKAKGVDPKTLRLLDRIGIFMGIEIAPDQGCPSPGHLLHPVLQISPLTMVSPFQKPQMDRDGK
jgi:hypothetical protein